LYKQAKYGPAPDTHIDAEGTIYQQFPEGSNVCDAHGYIGTVRYVGPVITSSDPEAVYIGVEWEVTGRGKHNGTVIGPDGRAVTYFVCPDGMGSFSQPTKLSRMKNKSKSDKVNDAQLKAWRALGTMKSVVAKQIFIQNLLVLAPNWDFKSALSRKVIGNVETDFTGSSPG
jgi:hypothetical protein